MSYWGEFRVHGRPLVAATLGLATGVTIAISTASLFAPALIKAFGWSRADYALLGTLSLVTVILYPLVGLLSDRIGVKRVATTGIAALPFTYVAASLQSGDIRVYFLIYFVQVAVGTTTAALVYSRVVATRFRAARGLALAITASGGAVLFALGGPALGQLIDTRGWQAGFQTLAVVSAAFGALTWLLLPNDRPAPRPSDATRRRTPYRQILRDPIFWTIGLSLWLCYMPHILFTSQFKLLLLEKGLSSSFASWLVSTFGLSVLVGRFACGALLDRFPTHIVSTLSLLVPAPAFLMLASGSLEPWAVVAAVGVMGVSQGAEIDLLSYVAARYFPPDELGAVFGLIFGGLGLFSALGSALLSHTLSLSDSFTPFLLIMAAVTVVGASLQLRLKHRAPIA